MDITGFMVTFIAQMVELVTWCWDMLNSITFFNNSLLTYSIAILILGVILDLMFSLVKATGSREISRRVAARSRERSKSNKGDE